MRNWSQAEMLAAALGGCARTRSAKRRRGTFSQWAARNSTPSARSGRAFLRSLHWSAKMALTIHDFMSPVKRFSGPVWKKSDGEKERGRWGEETRRLGASARVCRFGTMEALILKGAEPVFLNRAAPFSIPHSESSLPAAAGIPHSHEARLSGSFTTLRLSLAPSL